MVVNMENAFRYPLKDAKWIGKVLIGGVLMCVPIVNFMVFGYLMRILDDARLKKEPTLPEWQDWGALFQEGFMGFIVGLCYGMVLVLISLLGIIPFVGCLILPIKIAISFIMGPVVMIALCFYLEKKDLSAAFNFKGIIDKIKINLVDYLIVALVTGVIGFFIVLVCVFGAILIIPLLLALVAWFYIALVSCRLYGEIFSTVKTV